jgi:hypothetical protein
MLRDTKRVCQKCLKGIYEEAGAQGTPKKSMNVVEKGALAKSCRECYAMLPREDTDESINTNNNVYFRFYGV